MATPEKPTISNKNSVRVSEHGPTALSDHRSDIFFAAIETTRMPMLVTDPRRDDNPIVFANRAFLSMTGYTDEEIIGSNCRFLQGAETDRGSVAQVRQAISERREITIELLNYRKDGSSFWNALFISPVWSPSGELVYFFASQLDVSRRRDTERALSQAQKMEALGQLTGGIAHDFNNLLQVISGQLEIIKRRHSIPSAGSDLERRMTNIREAVVRAASLTEQLLAFSRKQRLDGRAVNLNALISNMSELVDRTLGEDIKLQNNLAADLAACKLDPTQFEVALLNVLVNARDAMPGGGTITVATGNALIEDDERAHSLGLSAGRYASIAVTDHGSGIAPEILTRVMDPFFTTKEEGRGTGLGLSTVYGFVKQSGGAIDLSSEVGVGTTVRMYFPIVDEPLNRPGPAARAGELIGGVESVLVVDDRVEIAEVARDLLQSLGYTVYIASRPAEAISRFATDPSAPPIDLLFTDIIMPGGMNGFVLAAQMQKRIPQLKVLLSTGFAESLHGNVQKSAYPVLNKPYRLADLARKVRSVLDGGGA